MSREMPECPVCGAECNEFYMSENHEIVGCDRCIVGTVDAWEYTQEQRLSALIDRGMDEAKDRGWD